MPLSVTIKPIVWTDDRDPEHPDGYTLFSAKTGVGAFSYGTDKQGIPYYQSPVDCRDVSSEAEAKIAAEAIHRRLVLELLLEHFDIIETAG